MESTVVFIIVFLKYLWKKDYMDMLDEMILKRILLGYNKLSP